MAKIAMKRHCAGGFAEDEQYRDNQLYFDIIKKFHIAIYLVARHHQ